MTLTTFELKVPRHLIMGGGCTKQLPVLIESMQCDRVLVVTDAHLREGRSVVNVVAQLEAEDFEVAVFCDVQPDPTIDNVRDGVSAFREFAADCVVAVGGGSSIDCAKAIAVMAIRGGDITDFAGYDRIGGPSLPLLAVPTTAGSGSECTRAAVISDATRGRKLAIYDDALLPAAALVDYEHTLTMPPELTAHVGLDALVHSVEAYTSRLASPASDMLALEAARLIGPNLRRVYRDGADQDARAAMMIGSSLAGAAFSNSSVALVHGMSRPLGAQFHIPHGLSNALLLATVVRYSLEAATGRYGAIARALGLASYEASDLDAGAALLSGLDALARDLDIPNLRQLGVDQHQFEAALVPMAKAALASSSPEFNARQPSHAEIVELYRAVY